MYIRLNRIAYPIYTLGPGQRLGLWVQGCSRRCPGCASNDTWDYKAGKKVEIQSLAIELFNIIIENNLTGLSITGGEPVDQADSLLILLELLNRDLRNWNDNYAFDVLMFSGYTYGEVNKIKPNLINEISALVCGVYDQTRPRLNRLVASNNQEFVLLDDSFEKEYDLYLKNKDIGLQYNLDSSGITFAGIPDPGDLDIIENKLKKKGIVIGGKSWQN